MKTGEYRILCAVCAALVAIPASGLEVPAGTPIEVRFKTKISTQTARAQDPIEALVIAPVLAGGQFAIPAGAVLRGAVAKTSQSAKSNERSLLVLDFREIEIDKARQPVAVQLASVDNAREKVDDHGQINGILASETITGQLDTELDKLASKYAGLAEVLGAAKNAVFKPPESDITYDAGTECELKLTQPLILAAAGGPGVAANVEAIPDETGLARLISREPFQTVAQSPPKPSDLTNLLLIGSGDSLRHIFQEAGWSAAAGLNSRAKFETVKALAEDRGYNEAPVSILLLDGKPPDVVFEKTNNTFAKRHHLRVWRRPVTFLGQPVWAVAATHDVGINFSQQDRTFIHRVDSNIDRERAKVVNDLLFTGLVRGIELLERPNVPLHAQNATGDNLDTDGKVAVLLLR